MLPIKLCTNINILILGWIINWLMSLILVLPVQPHSVICTLMILSSWQTYQHCSLKWDCNRTVRWYSTRNRTKLGCYFPRHVSCCMKQLLLCYIDPSNASRSNTYIRKCNSIKFQVECVKETSSIKSLIRWLKLKILLRLHITVNWARSVDG